MVFGDRLRQAAENLNPRDQLKQIQIDATDRAVKDAEQDNTVPEEAAEEASKDISKLNGFEKAALLVASFISLIGGKVPDKWKEFLEPGDESDPGEVFEANPDISLEGLSRGARSAISKIARSVVGSTEFRGPEVDGGNLACAQVASTILYRAGILDRPNLSVAGTEAALKRKGWVEHSGPPREGDAVIWNRQKKRRNGRIVLGHAHIGIMINDEKCVSNWSGVKMPREHYADRGCWNRRGVWKYLSPPSA